MADKEYNISTRKIQASPRSKRLRNSGLGSGAGFVGGVRNEAPATMKDGRTSYIHIMYSAVEAPTQTEQIHKEPDKYIGMYVDFSESDSLDPLMYTWSRFVGYDGADGKDGKDGADGKDGTKGDKGDPGKDGQDGASFSWNLLSNSQQKREVSHGAGGDHYHYYHGMTVYIEQGKTYTVSAKTDCPDGWTWNHTESKSKFLPVATLWLWSVELQQDAVKVISDLDMKADGTRGHVFTADNIPTGIYFIRFNTYAPGTYHLWEVKIEEGANRALTQWTPTYQENRGLDGLIAYPAGVYDPDKRYTTANDTTPIVEYNGKHYVLKRGVTYRGADKPEETNTPAKAKDFWNEMSQYQAIFTDILMADFAKLGRAVFYGDWMISETGRKVIDVAVKYRVGGDTAPAVENSDKPDGWVDAFPKQSAIAGMTIWTIQSERHPDGTKLTAWSTPAKITDITDYPESHRRTTENSTEYELFKHGAFEPYLSQNFKTGSMAAERGTFGGSIRTTLKTVADSDMTLLGDAKYNRSLNRKQYFLGEDLNIASAGEAEIILPISLSMIGARVLIADTTMSTVATRKGTTVATQDGSYISGIPDTTATALALGDELVDTGSGSTGNGLVNQYQWQIVKPSDPVYIVKDPDYGTGAMGAKAITFVNGAVEFLCVPCTVGTRAKARWMVLTCSVTSLMTH